MSSSFTVDRCGRKESPSGGGSPIIRIFGRFFSLSGSRMGVRNGTGPPAPHRWTAPRPPEFTITTSLGVGGLGGREAIAPQAAAPHATSSTRSEGPHTHRSRLQSIASSMVYMSPRKREASHHKTARSARTTISASQTSASIHIAVPPPLRFHHLVQGRRRFTPPQKDHQATR